MRWWNELKFIIRKLDRRRAAAELEEEIRTHLELETNEKIEAGHSPEEARHAARRVFGNVLITRENTRAVWGFGLLEILWNDLRYSAKTLQKTPGFTLAAVLTLGLGIGVNTAIYSGINAIFFKPLAGAQDPEQLCRIKLLDRSGRGFENVSYSDYLEIRQSNQTLGGLAAYRVSFGAKLGFKGQPRQSMNAERVSGNYFQVLGVRAALGRVLMPEDETDGAGNAIVLGHAAWRNLFQADPEIIGKEIIDYHDQRLIIVGVAPPDFHGAQPPIDTGYWTTINKAATLRSEMERTEIDRDFSLKLIGRIKRESSLRQVKAEMELFFSNFKQLRPEVYLNRFAGVELARGFGLSSDAGKGVFGVLTVTVTVVGVLLLIACANVASLQLSRAMSRRKEIAVRLALGASRRRIIWLLLTESLLLALLGGALAATLNFKTSALLSQALNTIFLVLPIKGIKGIIVDFSPDWYVFIVTLLISISVGVICGLVPSLKTSKADLTEVTKSEASLQAIRIRRLSWHNLLVVMQVAGSVLLLIGAGLILRSVRPALQVDPGFPTHNLFLTQANIDRKQTSPAENNQFIRDLLGRAVTLPNVKSVAAGQDPLRGGSGREIIPEGAEQKPFGDNRVSSYHVGPKYFETLGIPLVAGRDFTDLDLRDSRRIVIINETTAQQAFPGQNPIGRRLRLIHRRQDKGEPLEIIGVVKDVEYHYLPKETTASVYLPIENYWNNSTYIFVRTHHDSAATLRAMAKLILSMAPEAEYTLRTMDEALYLSTLPAKIVSAFFAFFGALGLILSSIGLLGVMGYSVARRTKEIGIRMALGADRSKVLKMIIGEGVALTITGIAIGVLAAAGLTRVMAGVIRPDLLSYGGTILVLLTAALLACYFPARKASRVDPMTALRHE